MVMAASLLRGYRAAQPLQHLRVIPLHRTQMPADLPAVSVDEEARRQASGVERKRGLGRRIDIQGQRLDARFRVELSGDGEALLIDRQRHHVEALAAKFR